MAPLTASTGLTLSIVLASDHGTPSFQEILQALVASDQMVDNIVDTQGPVFRDKIIVNRLRIPEILDQDGYDFPCRVKAGLKNPNIFEILSPDKLVVVETTNPADANLAFRLAPQSSFEVS